VPKARRRRLFVTTKTELKAIAAAAIMGLSRPDAASGALDHVDLVRRQDAGDDLVDADLARHGAGRPLVVAGEQHRAQAHGAQPPDRLR
jgi:hypothetical protein